MIFRIFDKDRQIKDVEKQIQKYFDFLFNRGFKIIDKFYDRKVFGNWTVLLCSEKHVIRFTQDRGYIILLIGPRLAFHDCKDSFLTSLNMIVRYLNKRSFDIRENSLLGDKDEQFQRLRKMLLDNYEEIFAFISQADFEEKAEMGTLFAK